MTIINFHLGPTRADIIADTLIVDRNGAHVGTASKIAVIPHLRAVVAARGDLYHLEKWESWWRESVTIREALSGGAHAAREIVRTLHELKPGSPDAEFISLAWEPTLGRVLGCINIPDRGYETLYMKDGTHAFPWIPGYPTAAAVPLLEVAREQFHHAAQTGVSADACGAWTEANVTSYGISCSIVPDFMSGDTSACEQPSVQQSPRLAC